MKLKKLALIITFIVVPVVLALAEGPGGPGSGPNGNGTPIGYGGTPVGGNAPIDGMFFILIYSGIYGLKKFYHSRKMKDPFLHKPE